MDTGELKQVLGCWASGVAVVTTTADARPHGMTVTAFSSVSLEPPLVLICARATSYTCARIEETGVFAVNILAAGQEHVSDRFAGRHDVPDRFEGVAYLAGALGCPILTEALATLECRLVKVVGAGDHRIYIGAVEGTTITDRRPLLYHRSGYRQMADACIPPLGRPTLDAAAMDRRS